jgi:hypothetical protein
MKRLLVPLLILLTSSALAEPIACPIMLDDGSARVVRYPRGWEPVPAQGVRLSSGGLIRGRPSDWGYLRPVRTVKTAAGGTASNDFARGEEKWLWCGYGGAGALQIAKRLPDAATICTVTHKESKLAGITELSAACR